MDKLNSYQISEWEAYDTIDPIGKWRDEFSFAKLSALIMNIVSQIYSKKGQGKEFVPLDFMSIWDQDLREDLEGKQSIDEMKKMFYAIANATKNNPKKEKK